MLLDGSQVKAREYPMSKREFARIQQELETAVSKLIKSEDHAARRKLLLEIALLIEEIDLLQGIGRRR